MYRKDRITKLDTPTSTKDEYIEDCLPDCCFIDFAYPKDVPRDQRYEHYEDYANLSLIIYLILCCLNLGHVPRRHS